MQPPPGLSETVGPDRPIVWWPSGRRTLYPAHPPPVRLSGSAAAAFRSCQPAHSQHLPMKRITDFWNVPKRGVRTSW